VNGGPSFNGDPARNGPFNDNPTNNDADFGFNQARRDFTTGAWLDAVLAVTPKIEVTPGLRADLFVSGGRVALSLDPRISARYTLSKKLAITHGLALVHQAPSFVVPVPGFKPSLAGGLQSALQYSAGVSYSLPQGFDSSFALFQNDFFNMTDLISVIQLENAANQNVTDVRATGHAYGAELMIRRSLARNVGGFVSYTLSRSVRAGCFTAASPRACWTFMPRRRRRARHRFGDSTSSCRSAGTSRARTLGGVSRSRC
jgi:hypothetical protein